MYLPIKKFQLMKRYLKPFNEYRLVISGEKQHMTRRVLNLEEGETGSGQPILMWKFKQIRICLS